MIDTNDVRKQVNLAQSAVLKMVEEEEYEKAHPAATNARKSRPRNRCISREDVLKINRRHPRRNISWPPPDDRSRSRSSDVENPPLDERVRQHREIFHLKEMSDRGPITKNKRNNFRPSSGEKITASKSQVANPSNDKTAQFNDPESAKCQQDWPPKSYYDDDNDKTLAKKTFHLPENELRIGKIEPIRKYFHEMSSRSDITRSSLSPSPAPPLAERVDYDGAHQDIPKRWRSYENITLSYNTPSSGCYSPSTMAENPHKKDNMPLERYKSNSYNELPPLKPRREHHKNVQATKKKLNLNNLERMEATKSDENLKIDSSKNNSIVPTRTIRFQVDEKNAADTASGMGLNVGSKSPELDSSRFRTKNSSETDPQGDHRGHPCRDDLLHNNNNNNNNNNRVGQSPNYDLASATANYETENSSTRSNVPTKLNAIVNNPQIVRRYADVHQNDAIKINDFTKHSKQSSFVTPEAVTMSSLESKEQRYDAPRKSPRKFHQSGKDTNLSVQNATSDGNLLPGTASSGQHSPSSNEEKYEQTTKRTTYKDQCGVSTAVPPSDSKNDRRRGMYFTDGEYIWGPCESPPLSVEAIPGRSVLQHEQHATRSLSAQRELVENAITQDILRINEYMKRAEQEVLEAERSVNDQAVSITPLQTIVKQIMLQKGLKETAANPIVALSQHLACFDPMAIENENMPVVDRALMDLLKTSQILESLNKTDIPDATLGNDVAVDSDHEARIIDVDDSRQATSSVGTISPSYYTSTESTTSSRTASATTIVDKIIQSKNILSGYLITKQSQEELFENIQTNESDIRPESSTSISTLTPSDYVNRKTFPETGNGARDDDGDDDDDVERPGPGPVADNRDPVFHINNFNDLFDSDKILSEKKRTQCRQTEEKIMRSTGLASSAPIIISRKDDKLIPKAIKSDQEEVCYAKIMADRKTNDSILRAGPAIHDGCTYEPPPQHNSNHLRQPSGDERANCTLPANIGTSTTSTDRRSDEPVTNYRRQNFHVPEHRDDVEQQDTANTLENENEKPLRAVPHSASCLSNYPASECNYGGIQYANETSSSQVQEDYRAINPADNRSRSRVRNCNRDIKVRSSSQPEENCPGRRHHYQLPARQHSFDSSESRYYASPSLYMTGRFSPAKGYKRVAWPPASDGISAQPSEYPNQPQYQPQTTQAFQPVSPQVQQPSYQPQAYQQPQLDQQQYSSQAQAQYRPAGRGQSAGVIQLRQEAPISQRPAPVFTSQPAAASFQGGANMRGDMKWPPVEYKEQAAAENEARRKLAMGPLFRPRRVNKDYSQFFAKNALNTYYPGYKIPPGTQHVYGEY